MRVDGNDYSVGPRVIGRFVEISATLAAVTASCAGQIVAEHTRDWGTGRTITDPAHQATAKALRADLAARPQHRTTREHADGHVVAIRALPDYDALFGVDFDPRPGPGTDRQTITEGHADRHHQDLPDLVARDFTADEPATHAEPLRHVADYIRSVCKVVIHNHPGVFVCSVISAHPQWVALQARKVHGDSLELSAVP